jgi:hypothetical protein
MSIGTLGFGVLQGPLEHLVGDLLKLSPGLASCEPFVTNDNKPAVMHDKLNCVLRIKYFRHVAPLKRQLGSALLRPDTVIPELHGKRLRLVGRYLGPYVIQYAAFYTLGVVQPVSAAADRHAEAEKRKRSGSVAPRSDSHRKTRTPIIAATRELDCQRECFISLDRQAARK